ncbi:MgtC/SapB family protein [Bacillus timonensis]|nr:MgtC/SapB family protein [Bacillus timonensis]
MKQFLYINSDFLIMMVRIFLAALLSGLVGLEREIKKHPAGFRTHLLVGVGSCLMILLSLYGFQPYINEHENIRFDPARIPSYVISGIGFLGAGTILVKGATVRGLTTAASIWVVAGLGLVVGAGMYELAVLTTLVVLLSLIFLNKLEATLLRNSKKHFFNIIVHKHPDQLSAIIHAFEECEGRIININVRYSKGKKNGVLQYIIEADIEKQENKIKIYELLSNIEMVQKIS